MTQNPFKQILEKNIRGSILYDEPMTRHTTFGIGGPAEYLVYPADKSDLATLLKLCTRHHISTHIIGSGSNVLANSSGVNGLVISLKKTFKSLKITQGLQIISESGVMMGTMVRQAIRCGICGLESLIGVPGTVGGALIMNAGAYGAEISKNLSTATVLTKKGVEKKLMKGQIRFSYRTSSFDPDEILIGAIFNGERGNPDSIRALRERASSKRKSSQPLRFRSAGSIFKNPAGEFPAGLLIDQSELKGTRCGDAEISEKHANFIVNRHQATSEDILTLIRKIRAEVYRRNKILLELEIKLLGFPSSILEEFRHA